MDEIVVRGVKEEKARGYMPDEDSDQDDWEEYKKPDGQGLPRTSKIYIYIYIYIYVRLET